MSQTIASNLARCGWAITESNSELFAFFTDHAAAVAACTENQVVVHAIITRVGIIPAPQKEGTPDV